MNGVASKAWRPRRAVALLVGAAVIALAFVAPARAEDEPKGTPGTEDPAVEAIRVYQRYISSLRHVRCRFSPSCSEYAAQAIAAYGLAEGSARAADRLMRCNASAAEVSPRGDKGVLLDPVNAFDADAGGARVPRWLLPPRPPEDPALPESISDARRAQLGDVLRFAHELEWRGDCERASTEYQRAASLVGEASVESWAFARVGGCAFAASRWNDAESSYLTAAMLAGDVEARADATWMGAACRFNTGSYEACERLLADRGLIAEATAPIVAADYSSPAGGAETMASASSFRVPALDGLCGLARGEWGRAGDDFRLAAERAPAPDVRERIGRLATFPPLGESLPHRSSGLAGTMSAVVPGTGQMYAGRAQDGVRTLLFNAVLILTVVSFARGEHVPAAILTGAVAVPFYLGNVWGASTSAKRFDRRQRQDLLERAIAESSR
jgi:putative membrane protein insertion efficiency factor